MKKLTAILCLVFVVGISVPVFANTPEIDQTFNLFDDPATLQRALRIHDLEQRAIAGDSEALNELNSLGSEIKDVFPNGSLINGAWDNATQVSAADWRSRKGENEAWMTQDNSARLQTASAGGLVPYRNPAPTFSRNILVTRDEGTPVQNEPHLCVDPEDSRHLIAVSHNYGYNAAPAVVSFDGGETWTTARHVPISEQSIFSGDPVVSCARGDVAYYNFMSLGQNDYMLLNQAVSIIRSDIVVSETKDGGMTWQQPSIVATNHVALETYPLEVDGIKIEVPVVATSFLDKNWIASGPSPNNPDQDNLYVSYTEFVSYYYVTQPLEGLYLLTFLQSTSEIKVHASTDNGETWQDTGATQPVSAIADVPGTLGAGLADLLFRTVQGSQLAVADDGTVYAAWYDSLADGYSMGNARYYVIKSTDAGQTWDEPAMTAEILEVQRQSRSVPFRTTSSPSMAAGLDGDIYLVFPARTPTKMEDDADIYFVRGEDSNGRLVLGSPILINQDETNNIQFFPAIAVSPDGAIHIMWGDTRDDPAGLKYHIYNTKSTDRGENWGFDIRDSHEPDSRVTDFPSNPNRGFPGGRFIGDYFGIAATDNEVYMVWTDTRLGEYGPVNSTIGFARGRAMQSPSAILNPSSGLAGKSIAIQAFGFQPGMSVFVQVGNAIAICGQTSDSGTVECNAVMPFMAPEQSQRVILFDESGNAAVTSFYVEDVVEDNTEDDQNTAAILDSLDSIEQSRRRDGTIISTIIGLLIVLVPLMLGFFVLHKIRRRNGAS